MSKIILGVEEFRGRGNSVGGSDLFGLIVTSLAEDIKLSTCGRHPSLFFLSFYSVCLICFCFVFQVKCLPSKFGGAFSYVLPNLCHSSGIVFLDTLGTMCHFSLGVG
jgi:hypothetical protein